MNRILLFLTFLFLQTAALAQAPANDVCADAQPLVIGAGGTVCATGTNLNATVDATFNTCNPAPGDPGVWYTYTVVGINNEITVTPASGASGAQQVTVSVFNQGCGLASSIACNASTTAAGAATVNQVFTPGMQIWVLVTSNGAPGQFEVCVESTTPPSNDLCSNAASIITVLGDTVCATGTTFGATNDGFTTTCNSGTGGQTVWYTFAAQGTNSQVVVTPTGTNPAQNLTVVMMAQPCGSSTYDACNASATPTGAASATWTYTPGTQVWVQVTSDGAPGSFNICVISPAPPVGPGAGGTSCQTPVTLCSLDPWTSPNPLPFPTPPVSCFVLWKL